MDINIQGRTKEACSKHIMPERDALQVLEGRWKINILVEISFGPRRFKEIAHGVKGITDKVLSAELKDLEANKIISRTVKETFPPVVEYEITEHGKTLFRVIQELGMWGRTHRKVIMEKD